MKRNYKWVLTLIAAGMMTMAVAAQEVPEQKAPENWFNLDPETDQVPGVSTERAYKELLAGLTADTVIVAVIDGGVEVDHEDLLGKIWRSDEHTSELQSLMRISYAVFCLKKTQQIS